MSLRQRQWTMLGYLGCLAAVLAAVVLGVLRGRDARAGFEPRASAH